MPRVERLRTTHTVTTEDGWELVVYRDRPRRLSTSVPVLLLHGLASTSECWYGGRGGGIGTSLAHAGRDVWAVELRGGPDSQPPGRRRAWRMSEKLHLDVPAVIDFVREQTGEDQIDAVGHSMGGILLTLHTLTRQRSAIRRLVTIGSPLTLEQRILPRLLRSRFGEGVARALGRVPLRALSSQFSAVLPARLLPTHFEPALAERTTVRGVYARQVADVFGQELSELVRWIADQDPQVLLADNLSMVHDRVPVPTLFLVGARDSLTTARAVQQTYDRVGHARCELHVLGRESGYEYDYRHFDILVGGRIASEAAPMVVDWVNAAQTTTVRWGYRGQAVGS